MSHGCTISVGSDQNTEPGIFLGVTPMQQQQMERKVTETLDQKKKKPT